MTRFYWTLIAVSAATSVIVLVLGIWTATLEWIVAPFALTWLTIVFYRSFAVETTRK